MKKVILSIAVFFALLTSTAAMAQDSKTTTAPKTKTEKKASCEAKSDTKAVKSTTKAVKSDTSKSTSTEKK